MKLAFDGLKAAVIYALASAPLAWQSPAELAASIGLDAESVEDGLADLEVDGLVQPWEFESTPVPLATFTPYAAERLGLELVECGRDLHPRWQPAEKVEARPIRAGGPFRDYYYWNLGRFLPLPRPGARACA